MFMWRALKDTFAYRDRVTWKDHKIIVAHAPCQTLAVNFQNFVTLRTVAADGDALRRGDAGIAAGHRNGLEKIYPRRTSFRHFEAAGAIDLSEHRKAALRRSEERHIH